MRFFSAFLLLVFLSIASSCTFFDKIKQERLGTDKPVIPNYGNRFEVYYGAKTVGWCDYTQKAVEYSDYDSETKETFTEEISFRDMRYKFKFILFGPLVEIHILRYDSQGIQFRPNDSFAIIKNVGGVYYKYFGETEDKVIREVQIREPQKVANTEELYKYCTNYLTTYINLFRDRKSRDARNNRVQSLAYELLQFDRL